METEIAADLARGFNGIMTGDASATGSGQKKCGKNAEQSGFAGAVCAEKGDGFASADRERYVLQSGEGRTFERLEEGTPARAGRREKLDEGFDGDRDVGHGEVITRPETRNNLRELVFGQEGLGGKEVARWIKGD